MQSAQARIKDLVLAEERQRLLVLELNHRVRNMMQVVIGVANQTLHRSDTLPQFETAFMGRMQALGRAHELLSSGASRAVTINELLDAQLAAFATRDERYTTQGANVLLTAGGALSMGLVFHELATNAVKYGALSTASGRIAIAWRVEPRADRAPTFVLCWKETGGPPVTPPAHKGFGSELVDSQMRHDLQGEAKMEFAREGLRVTFSLPARTVILNAGTAG